MKPGDLVTPTLRWNNVRKLYGWSYVDVSSGAARGNLERVFRENTSMGLVLFVTSTNNDEFNYVLVYGDVGRGWCDARDLQHIDCEP